MAKARRKKRPRTALSIEQDHPALAVCEPRERKFVLAYLACGVRRRAAEQAGYAAASQAADRLMRRPRVMTALAEMRREYHAAEIAEPRECLAHLSEIARDPEARAADRISAASTIMKAMGALGPDAVVAIDARTQAQIVISSDAPLDMLDALALLQRVADGEAVTPEEAADVIAKIGS